MRMNLLRSTSVLVLALVGASLADDAAGPTGSTTSADRFVKSVALRLGVALEDCRGSEVLAPGRMTCGSHRADHVAEVAHEVAMQISSRGTDVLHVEPMLDRPELYQARHPAFEQPRPIAGLSPLVFLFDDERVVVWTSSSDSTPRRIVFAVESLGAPFPLDFPARFARD